MKYNMKEIMKIAWELVRKAKVSLSTALKMSWVVARKALWIAEHDKVNTEDFTWNIWVGFGHIRAYYKCSKWSRYQNEKRNHFVEL